MCLLLQSVSDKDRERGRSYHRVGGPLAEYRFSSKRAAHQRDAHPLQEKHDHLHKSCLHVQLTSIGYFDWPACCFAWSGCVDRGKERFEWQSLLDVRFSSEVLPVHLFADISYLEFPVTLIVQC